MGDLAHALLTERQREFVRGEVDDELSDGAERQMRKRIRERVAASMWDFFYLFDSDHFTEEDIEQVFGDELLTPREKEEFQDDTAETHVLPKPSVPRTLIPSALSFFYLADDNFEDSIEKGVEDALAKQGWDADVDCRLLIEKRERLDELLERTQAGEISQDVWSKAVTLRSAGLISEEEASEIVHQHYEGSEE